MDRRIDRTAFRWCVCAVLLCASESLFASDACPVDSAQFAAFVSVQGNVASNGRLVTLNDPIRPGETIKVGANSRAAIFICNTDSVLRLDQNTELTLSVTESDGFLLDLLRGVLYFFSERNQTLDISTPFVNAGVSGTEFLIRVQQTEDVIVVFEGELVGHGQTWKLSGGEEGVFTGTASLVRPVVQPRNAVQWAVHYLPILGAINSRRESAELNRARRALNRGEISDAFHALEESTVRDALFFAFRAGLWLAVGRVDEARADIDRAMALEPAQDVASALQIVIDVTESITIAQQAETLKRAKENVDRWPDSGPALIARSYAQQALFELAEALESVKQANLVVPDNALAMARLSELHLALGEIGASSAAAELAVGLDAEVARAHTVLGYARLAEGKFDAAARAFEAAIELDQADPLPRLGNGLVKIRQDAVHVGRSQLEIAVALDPRASLTRSYLGKAYFTENRDDDAASQLSLAKALDPLDPTPWLYSAILKQAAGQPIDALRDIEESIERNDNRGVYRSRLLLDEDLAVRGARQGLIYRDLRFERLALLQGWDGLDFDPANHSAHRLLADSYLLLPRHEIARDSELLQSQLLQPVNINPVQAPLASDTVPHLQDTGPSEIGFNEFTRVFAENGVQFHGAGMVGSNSTIAGNAIVSGIHDNVSYSVGGFHFETDGFRQNNDFNQNIYNAFLQTNFSYRTSAQVEIRKIDDNAGDRFLLFDPDNFFPDQRRDVDVDSIRLGFRHGFSPNSTLIASYIYRKDKESLRDPAFGIDVEEDTHFFETRHIFHERDWNVTGGFGILDGDVTEVIEFPGYPTEHTKSNLKHRNAYVYGQVEPHPTVLLTLGASYDSLEELDFDADQVNPKLGVVWRPTNSTSFRAAAFRVLKRTLSSSQTIEPTNVAGFNQFYDDVNGTDAWQYGLALDQRITSGLFLGGEVMWRDLKVPVNRLPPASGTVDIDEDERFARAYIYWLYSDWLAVSSEYQYQHFSRNKDFSGPDQLVKVDTHLVPIEIGAFAHNGLFGRARTTYVAQDGKFFDSTGSVFNGKDNFWVTDVVAGYTFPKGRGSISVGVQNVFNQDFRFQDSDPQNPRISPERFFQFQLTLNL